LEIILIASITGIANNEKVEIIEEFMIIRLKSFLLNNKVFASICCGILIGIIGTYFIEGRYIYIKQGSEIIRINKITSSAARLTNIGWQEMTPFTKSDFPE
jgi:hypothetical protein